MMKTRTQNLSTFLGLFVFCFNIELEFQRSPFYSAHTHMLLSCCLFSFFLFITKMLLLHERTRVLWFAITFIGFTNKRILRHRGKKKLKRKYFRSKSQEGGKSNKGIG